MSAIFEIFANSLCNYFFIWVRFFLTITALVCIQRAKLLINRGRRFQKNVGGASRNTLGEHSKRAKILAFTETFPKRYNGLTFVVFCLVISLLLLVSSCARVSLAANDNNNYVSSYFTILHCSGSYFELTVSTLWSMRILKRWVYHIYLTLLYFYNQVQGLNFNIFVWLPGLYKTIQFYLCSLQCSIYHM